MLKVSVPKEGEILNERPEGMPFEEYQKKRKEQCLRMKGFRLKGVHVRGRLEGVLVPSKDWTNSRDVVMVIE